MTSWQNDKLAKWQVGKMTSWQNDKLAKWQVGKMTIWQNDQALKNSQNRGVMNIYKISHGFELNEEDSEWLNPFGVSLIL